MRNVVRGKTQKGFTIIEILIVLAIAGLILLIVFLAVPALQRNSRNTSRRSDVAHLAGIVNEYAANHGGTLPKGVGVAANQMDITNEKWAIMNAPVTANIYCGVGGGCGGTAAANSFPAAGNTNDMWVVEGFSCDPTSQTLTAGSSRTFSVTFRVETGGADQNSCIQG